MNPYLVPTRGDTAVSGISKSKDTSALDLAATDTRSIIRSWERLRVVYNLLLLPLGLIIVHQALTVGFAASETAFGALTVGFGANAFFFFGPLFEIYACSSRDISEFGQYRYLPFMLGLVASLGLFYLGYILVGYSAPMVVNGPWF